MRSSHGIRVLSCARRRIMCRIVGAAAVCVLATWARPQDAEVVATLPYRCTDATFDCAHGAVWLTAKARRTIEAFDLATGALRVSFTVAGMPESLTMSADGRRLYVALLAREHGSDWFDEDGHEGAIAEFDLDAGAKLREFTINEDPCDLAVTDSGFLIVAGGSGQLTHLRSYDLATVTNVSSCSIRQLSRLALHPSQQAVYTCTTDVSPTSMDRRGFDPVTGSFLASWSFPYVGRIKVEGDASVHPSGAYVVTRAGNVFSSSGVKSEDMVFMSALEKGLAEKVVFDRTNRALMTVAGDRLQLYGDETLLWVRSFGVPSGAAFAGVAGEWVYVLSRGTATTVLSRLANPAHGGAANTPPAPDFTWRPSDPAAGSAITFDAAATADAEEPSSALRYRWDWESDGIWDTGFLATPEVTHTYALAGTKMITVEALDSLGLAGRATKTCLVAVAGQVPDPQVPQPIFELQAPATDTVFSARTGALYAARREARCIAKVDLATGAVVRTLPLPGAPLTLTLAPDGRFLYACLWPDPSPGTFPGGIAEIDTDDDSLVRTLLTEKVPFDLAITTHGYIIASSYSQATMCSYRRDTGEVVNWAECDGGSRLALHPSHTVVYAINESGNPYKVACDPTTGVLHGYGSRYQGALPRGGNVFAHPNGAQVITRDGGVYSSTTAPEHDIRYVMTLEKPPADDALFDESTTAFLTVGGESLCYYNSASMLLVKSYAIPAGGRGIGLVGEWLYAVSVADGRTIVSRLLNPALGAVGNTPPAPEFTWSPGSPDADDEIAFDAGATTDAQDALGQLFFRWDWEGDGSFDTEFRTSPTATHQFGIAGSKNVTLQVRDSFGLQAMRTLRVDVARLQTVLDPSVVHPDLSLHFKVTDAVFDPARPVLYAIGADARRLACIDLDTGFTFEELRFDAAPQLLALSPNGRWLYVSIVAEGEYLSSRMVELDTANAFAAREFAVGLVPYSMVATDRRDVIVSGYMNGDLALWYSAITGTEVARTSSHSYAHYSLHPSQTRAYAIDGGTSLRRVDFDPATGAMQWRQGGSMSSYDGGPHVLFSMHPDGTYMVTGEYVLACTGEHEGDMMRLATLPVGYGGLRTAFDAERHAFFTVWQNKLCWYNDDNFVLSRTYQIERDGSFVGVAGRWVYALSVGDPWSLLARLENPVWGAEQNTPPAPDFSFAPANPAAGQTITFDANGTVDAEDGLAALSFRWDWEGDGVFDTEFAAAPITTHVFGVAGTKRVTLQARDRFGGVGDIVREVNVAMTVPPDPTVPSTAFDIPFEVSDAAFDPVRPLLYVIGNRARCMLFVDLRTGFVVHRIEFDHAPHALAVRPDGGRVYVGVSDRDYKHGAEGKDGGTSTIMAFDPETGALTGRFDIAVSLRDMVVTDGGVLVVLDDDSVDQELHGYRLPHGNECAIADVFSLERIALHPSQRVVYGGTSNWLDKYMLDDATGAITPVGTYRPDGYYPMGHVFAHSDGVHLITSGGGVFATSDEPREDTRFVRRLEGGRVTGIAFDSPRRAMFTVGLEGEFIGAREVLCHYNSGTIERARRYELGPAAQYVGVSGGNADMVFALSVRTGSTVILRMENPARGGEDNTPPAPDFSWSPGRVDAVTAVTFDARASTDAQDALAALVFRWDWNYDGVFETEFSSEPTAQHRFGIVGSHTVALEAMDRHGLRRRIRKTFDVVIGNDPGEEPETHVPHRFDFAVADGFFDPWRACLYLSCPDEKRLVKVDAATGRMVRQFRFGATPDVIAVSSDGRWMYVALVSSTHCTCQLDEVSFVAELDLVRGVRTREFALSVDATDMAVTASRELFVVDAGGLDADLIVYDVDTGVELARMMLGYGVPGCLIDLAAGSSERSVYAAYSKVGVQEINKYLFDRATGTLEARGWRALSTGGRIAVDRAGSALIARNGQVYVISDDPFQDLRPMAQLQGGCDAVAFGAAGATFMRGGRREGIVHLHDAWTLAELEHATLPSGDLRLLGLWGRKGYALQGTDGSFVLHEFALTVENAVTFLRGDANTDGLIDIADAITIAESLFRDRVLACRSAADVNDDGNLDVSDAVYTLRYLFLADSPPPPPFGACASDTTADGLECQRYDPCLP